jgi:dephospho-CoA kinase
VVEDVPLLVENNLQGRYDVVVVVDASPETQVGRLSRARGMSASDAQARMTTQATREQRAAVADVVIDNDGDFGALQTQTDALWDRLSGATGQP